MPMAMRRLAEISIHPPREGRDHFPALSQHGVVIPIHPPREGRDPHGPVDRFVDVLFQSTLPVRGGTLPLVGLLGIFLISIPPPRVGRDGSESGVAGGIGISIHPPRVGRDKTGRSSAESGRNFNPHSPQGEGRPLIKSVSTTMTDFNPPSPQGEGRPERAGSPLNRYFNPPSPCGEGRQSYCPGCNENCISIHPPRMGEGL